MILNRQLHTLEMNSIWQAVEAMNKELEADLEKNGFYVSANTLADGSLTVEDRRRQEHLDAFARERMGMHFGIYCRLLLKNPGTLLTLKCGMKYRGSCGRVWVDLCKDSIEGPWKDW
jgi:hypothetical protein